MSNFCAFREAVNKQLDLMIATGQELFKVDVDKTVLWETYLSSFPAGTNEMYLERTEHDCQCCKQFIRDVGRIVTIGNGMSSVWDVNINDTTYQPVADALSALIKSSPISNVYRHYEKNIGAKKNHSVGKDGKAITWEHFYYTLPSKVIMRKDDIATHLGKVRTNYQVLESSLTEISTEAIEIVSELIHQNAIYRGAEHKAAVTSLTKTKRLYDKVPTDEEKVAFLWSTSGKLGPAGRFKNTVIGTLLVDISSGVELTKAVKSFEAKVAPSNYKRPTALITGSMIKKAQEKVEELGLTSALERRFAQAEDLTVNNVLFVDKSSKKLLQGGVFDDLVPTKITKPKLDSLTEVTIDNFIENILPKAEAIELMFENRHANNLVSLIGPTDPDSSNILKWDNNFSWSYNGEVADSMKERVKAAGGSVTGVLRYSIQWNEEGEDRNIDFDAHCTEPSKNLISFHKKGIVQKSSGKLDVDIMTPGNKIAVENITWSDKNKMPEGVYKFVVHNYSSRVSKGGFSAEIEFEGKVHSLVYTKPLKGNQKVAVAEVTYSKKDGFSLNTKLSSTSASKEVWELPTQQFHKVDMVMLSPNFWDDQKSGNKHWFFMLQNCLNPEPARGFYNEFLRNELTEHSKVFEVLSEKLKASKSDNQLSGLGFSSTQKNSVVCKVSGTFNQTIKINF